MGLYATELDLYLNANLSAGHRCSFLSLPSLVRCLGCMLCSQRILLCPLKDGDVAVPFISLHVQCLLEMSMLRLVCKERRDPNTHGGLLSPRGGTASVSILSAL